MTWLLTVNISPPKASFRSPPRSTYSWIVRVRRTYCPPFYNNKLTLHSHPRYAHILNYLRTPVMPGSSDSLPRSLRLAGSPNTASTLDALIDVREEAAFLGLDSLYRLCSDEIRQRYSPKPMHARGNSSSNVNVHNSTHSLHTLVERAETPLNTLSSSSTGSTGSAPAKLKPQRMNTDPKGPVPVPAVVQPEHHVSLHKKANASVSSLAALASPPPGWI